MESKTDRLKTALENIEAAVKYYLKEVKNNYLIKKIGNKEYERTVKDLTSIGTIVADLKIATTFVNKKLDKIRVINYSLMPLYEKGDYNIIFSEISNINNEFCKDFKDDDRRELGELRKAFNLLPKFYQFRLNKAEKSSVQEIHFHDKGVDNYQFIITNYLNVKYNFKRVKYDDATINLLYQQKIDECNIMTESKNCPEDIKSIYSSIKYNITKYANAEAIITNLLAMRKLCDEEEYANLVILIDTMIDKYKLVMIDNKEKYDTKVQQLGGNNPGFIEQEEQKMGK